MWNLSVIIGQGNFVFQGKVRDGSGNFKILWQWPHVFCFFFFLILLSKCPQTVLTSVLWIPDYNTAAAIFASTTATVEAATTATTTTTTTTATATSTTTADSTAGRFCCSWDTSGAGMMSMYFVSCWCRDTSLILSGGLRKLSQDSECWGNNKGIPSVFDFVWTVSVLVISPVFVGFFLHYLFIIHYYTIHCKICNIKEHESFGECNWTEDVGWLNWLLWTQVRNIYKPSERLPDHWGRNFNWLYQKSRTSYYFYPIFHGLMLLQFFVSFLDLDFKKIPH